MVPTGYIIRPRTNGKIMAGHPANTRGGSGSCAEAYNFVCLLLHCSKAVGRSDGYGEDEFLRLAQSGGPQRRACCRAGSNAIVDHNCATTNLNRHKIAIGV
jgi:hypothetical protein